VRYYLHTVSAGQHHEGRQRESEALKIWARKLCSSGRGTYWCGEAICITKGSELLLTIERLEGNHNEIADIRYEISCISCISRLSISEKDSPTSRRISITSIYFTALCAGPCAPESTQAADEQLK
jgi:hypothetical protein